MTSLVAKLEVILIDIIFFFNKEYHLFSILPVCVCVLMCVHLFRYIKNIDELEFSYMSIHSYLYVQSCLCKDRASGSWDMLPFNLCWRRTISNGAAPIGMGHISMAEIYTAHVCLPSLKAASLSVSGTLGQWGLKVVFIRTAQWLMMAL